MSVSAPTPAAKTWFLVAVMCGAQVMVQIGAFFWPALLPTMMPLWALSNSEAGWITAIFYGAYMISVPVLVTATDRIDPKFIYLFGVGVTIIGHLGFALFADSFWPAMAARALTGMGWAGTYMTGLKLLADRVDARMMSRATAGHAASIGLSGAVSFAFGDAIAGAFGWQAAFITASASAAVAWLVIAIVMPRREGQPPRRKDGGGLFDFRPVFRNRSAMAYAIAYAIHTLEMSALRGWAVAFLGYVALTTGTMASIISPAVVATGLGIAGTVASIGGNEAAIRFGRRRLVQTAMLASIMFGASIGFLGGISYALAAALLFLYAIFIWLDSSSLTAGAAGSAEPSRRGATLAVHSMLGYSGGFLGPLLIGWTLDLTGGMSTIGWGSAFLSVAVLMTAALLTFRVLRPQGLAGDRTG
jgi:predicted MFS family arabinose efflux permease